MTAPFLSLAQILSRLTLTARSILRDHRPASDGRCPICRTAGCPVAAAARDVLRGAEELRQLRGGRPAGQPDLDQPPWTAHLG